MGLFATPAAPYVAPQSKAQPADQYQKQIYANQSRAESDLQRAQERERLLTRGRELAGFVLIDRRYDGMGWEWQRRNVAAWPAQMPAPALAAIERALIADQAARTNLAGAEHGYQLWAQQHPTASDELRRVKYEESTIDQLASAQKAAQQLDAVLVDAAALVESIDEWVHIASTADARRAAVEKRREQDLNRIELEVTTATSAARRAGVQL